MPRRQSEVRRESILDRADSHYSRTSFGDFGGSDRKRNTKSILYIMLAFLAMAYTGVTFVFSILAYNETSGRTWHISQLVDNWKMKPIVSIMATEEPHWASGYEPIVGNIWPGTFRGWYWPKDVEQEKIRDSLVIGRWDTIQTANRCLNIDARNPIFIRRFYPDRLIWVQRMGQSIINMRRTYEFKDNKCPSDYKTCGPEGKPEYQTWVSSSVDCPIISFYVDTENQSGPDQKYQGFTEVNLSQGNSIYYSSTDSQGELPISEFTLSEGEGNEQKVCVNLEDYNVPKGRKIYDLLNTNFYQGCISNVDGMQYDERWNFVTQVSEKDIYNTNDLFFDQVHSLPNWPNEEEMSTNKYNLFLRKYILWREEWEIDQSSRMQNLAENLNPLNTLANAQLFFMVICFLSLLVMGISTPIFIIIRHCMILRGEKKATYKDVIISTGMRFVSFIFIVLKAAFLISCLVLISNYHSIYEKARVNEWTDRTTIFILGYVDEFLDYARKHNWVSLSAVIVIAFCEMICIGTLYILKKISDKQRHDARQSLLDSLAGAKD